MAGVDRSQLAAVSAEINQRRGCRVRAVHQTGKLCFRLALEGRGGRVDLVLDLDPEFPRLNLAPPQPAPQAPSPLASGMRRALRGALLDGAKMVPGERALALAFRRGAEAATLWFEAFGRGANLYLVDGDGIVRLTPRGQVAARRGARVGNRFRPVPPREGDGAPTSEGSAAVAEEASRRDADRQFERRQTALLKHLRREERRLIRQLEQLESMAERGLEAEQLRRRGELLRASFHLLEPGLERVRVPDPDDPQREIDLEIDPRRAPGDQIAACFRAAKKADRGATRSREQIPLIRDELARCRAALQEAAEAADPAVLDALAGRLGIQAAPDRPAGPAPGARDWLTFLSSEGWRILVGRNARGNDRLTVHQARPSDLFLHVRGGSGSHVIVPTPRGKTVPRDTLLEAAELACWFSARRAAEWSEVDYALKRYVRKPRKAAPGAVIVERARTLRLRPDAARRRRLLATRRK